MDVLLDKGIISSCNQTNRDCPTSGFNTYCQLIIYFQSDQYYNNYKTYI